MNEGKKFLSRRDTEPGLWPDTVQVNENPTRQGIANAMTADRLRELATHGTTSGTPMVPLHQDTLRALADKLEFYERGWLEAAVAWEVCASIHRSYAKGKDAVFNTRQGDYVRHGDDARKAAQAIREGK